MDPLSAASSAESTTSKKPIGFLTLVDDAETFPYVPEHNGVKLHETTLMLRMVPDSVSRASKRKNTKIITKKGQQITDLDFDGYVADCLDYAIVSWAGVRNQRGEELTCSLGNKLRLPEKFKADVMRLCVQKEAGMEIGEGTEGNE